MQPHPIVLAGTLGVGLLVSGSPPDRSLAQAPGATAARAAVPFAPGERSAYQVRLAGIPVGRGVLEVLGIETVGGYPTYRTRLHVQGGIPLARVDTRLESWIDVKGLFSRRYEEDKQEIRFRRQQIYDFYPESASYRIRGSGEVGRLASRQPLDDVSFLFYARTLPLRPGDTYTLPRYFKEDGNPVVIRVLRRETITVPAGTFETIVVQPIIRTDGLFGQ
ncbi:MAG TPA: DUF3108 domain-containing protein, partial [Longimicrobiaceae bacterium]|nr:DUF3108 domain-containing protein [Longimicrobiaceae bacterium]